jgi:Concanavalin A-like lectin/glucanases superfamily/Fibronectin type III domain
MIGQIVAPARRLAASSSWRLAAALTTVLVIASPPASQATPVAASIPAASIPAASIPAASIPAASIPAAPAPVASTPAAHATPLSPQNAIPPVGTVRPAMLNPSTQGRPQGHTVVPLRTIDPNALRIAKQKAAQAPSSPQPSIARTAPKTSLYNNINQAGIAAGDEGACCTPPDTTGSIGPNNYLEIVNNLVRVYDRSINRISDMDLGTFTGTPAGLNTSDPQMQWDAQGNRWLYAAVAFATGNNYLLLGWSKTADPSDLVNGWCHYGLFTANLLQDYPKLGHDNNYLMVGANEYDDRTSGFAFVTAAIWALPKPALGDASCAVGSSTHFGDPTHVLLNADGSPAFTPVPVDTSDSSNAGYIVAAHSPADAPVGPRTKVMAWHLVKGTGGPQLVQDGDLTVRSFNVPPPIPQPGPTIDSLDARLTQAVGHKDPDAGNAEAVWTQHTVVSTTSRSVVRWYELIPSQLKVRQQGEISSATDYLFNAAISPSILGNDAALFYDRASASLTPVIGAVSRTHADPLSTMGSELLIGTSVAADTDLSCSAPYGPPCRWGDYSGASPDPNVAGIVWGANQLNGPTFFGYPQWATRIFAVAATVFPDFSLTISPTGRAVTPPGSATYTVTVTDQGGFSGAVTLSAAGLPAGTSAAFSPNPATTTSTLTLTTTGSTPAGTSLVTVTGVNGSLTHNTSSTLVVTAASTYASTILADGPNAYWRLGETSGIVMVDSTSNANTGSYVGGVTLNQPGAIVGDGNGAVLLDGSTGYGRAPNSSTLSLTGAVSVEAWVKWTATATGTQDIIYKGDGATVAGTAFALANVTGCAGCGLGFYSYIGNAYTCACQSSALPAGQWFHLVGTRTAGGQLGFYVNGSLVASASDSGGPLNTVTAGVGIGASGSSSSLYPANARLDEATIYPTALTAAQVTHHYQASGQAVPPPGPPTNVSATASVNQATVSWTPPSGMVTGYIATAYAGTAAKNSVAVGGTSTSATLYGLQGGTSYTVQVRAVNAQGTGGATTSNAVTPTGSASTYTSTVLGDGPALYYQLGDPSGTISPDSSGAGNTGVYNGGLTQNQPGALGSDPDGATLLDGVTGDIRAPNSSSLSISGAISLEAWVKWTATPTGAQDIIHKGDALTLAGSSYSLAYIPGCAGCGLGLYTYVGNSYACACQSAPLPAGRWFHLVGTRTAGGQLAFYVNGSQVATANDAGGALNTVPSGVGVGASGSGSGSSLYPVNGTIDEAAVYPLALTATQVSNHYQASGNANPPGAPASVSATAGSNQAVVSWQPPTGGTALTGYIVTAYVGTSARTSVAVSGSTGSVTVFGLQGGITYTIQVKAFNANGSGPATSSSAVTPSGAATTYASTVLGDGPAFYARLDDPSGSLAADSSGNGSHARYVGGVSLNQPGALGSDPDGAVTLDGSTGYVSVPNTSSLNLTGAISVEAWVKWTATPTGAQDIIYRGDSATVAGTSFSLAYIPGCGGCGLGFYSYIGNAYTCACQSSALPAGQWFHLVGTRAAGGQLAFYVNGSQVATASDSGGALNTVPQGIAIGASGSGTTSSLYPVNGTLDEVAVYPQALTATQVSTHYHAAGY